MQLCPSTALSKRSLTCRKGAAKGRDWHPQLSIREVVILLTALIAVYEVLEGVLPRRAYKVRERIQLPATRKYNPPALPGPQPHKQRLSRGSQVPTGNSAPRVRPRAEGGSDHHPLPPERSGQSSGSRHRALAKGSHPSRGSCAWARGP